MEIKKLQDYPLKLTNKGELSLFFIGVGSAFSKLHYQTNLLIIKGEDHLLIDCGTRTPQALDALKLPLTDIRNFLITHSHADHIGGLEEVMLLNRYVTKKKPLMLIDPRYQKILWMYSLRGGVAFNEDNTGKNIKFNDLWLVKRPQVLDGYPRETLEAQLGSINIKMFRTRHIPDNAETWEKAFWSCGVIIDERILFSSDTQYDREMLLSFSNLFSLEMIFHDCQFFTGGVHASLDQLNELPESMKARMILTHYGDDWESHSARVREYGFHSLAGQWQFYNF